MDNAPALPPTLKCKNHSHLSLMQPQNTLSSFFFPAMDWAFSVLNQEVAGNVALWQRCFDDKVAGSLSLSLSLFLELYFVQMRSCVRCGKVHLLGGPKCSAGVFIWKKGSSPPGRFTRHKCTERTPQHGVHGQEEKAGKRILGLAVNKDGPEPWCALRSFHCSELGAKLDGGAGIQPCWIMCRPLGGTYHIQFPCYLCCFWA